MIFTKSPKFTNQSKAHLCLIFHAYLFHKSSKCCQVDHLIYPPKIPSEGVRGSHYILRGGVTVSQAAAALQGAPWEARYAQLRTIYFPINNRPYPESRTWGRFSLEPRMFFFCYSLSPLSRERNWGTEKSSVYKCFLCLLNAHYARDVELELGEGVNVKMAGTTLT